MSTGNLKKDKAPDVTIDEALELFLKLSFPHGIPEDVNKEELYKVLREKIAKDRPQWAQKSGVVTETPNQPLSNANSQRYSQLKQAVYDKANKPDLPDDPQERYLYERNQEALANLAQKKENEKIDAKNQALRQRLIDQTKSDPDEINRRNLKIVSENFPPKNPIQNRQQLSLDEDSEVLKISSDPLNMELDQEDALQKQLEFFKKVEKMDREGRIAAMQAFNQSRKNLIGTKNDSLKPRNSFNFKGDERFSLDSETVKEKKSKTEEQGEKFINYIKSKRIKSTPLNDSGLQFSSWRKKKLGLELE